MNICITIYPRAKQPTLEEYIKEYTRKLMHYYLTGGQLPPETNQATPEVLNALYDICYPKSHIQKLYERGLI